MSSHKGQVILFRGPGAPFERREFPGPERLEPGAVWVRTTLATLCGSDLHTWKGRRPFPTPSVLGHEIVGRVVQLGAGVEQDTAGHPLTEGDRITWTMMASCGGCFFCRLKRLPQKCLYLFKYGHVRSDEPPYFTGGLGEYVYLRPGTGIFKIPEDLTDQDIAPLMCAGATVTAGLEKVGIHLGNQVVIQGAGMLGLYATALAREQGAQQVIVIDPVGSRLVRARELGADVALNASHYAEDELVDQVRERTGGWGADVVVEVTGSPAAIPWGLRLLRLGGRYLLQGSLYPGDAFTLDGHDVITRCLTLTGLHNYETRHLGQALDFVHRHRHRYPFRSLVGPSFPLTVEGVTGALQVLESREAIRPAIVW